MNEGKNSIVGEKLCILTVGPTCSGKSTCAVNLAKAIPNIVFLDKDDVIILSNRVFAVAEQPVDRQSGFFKTNIRDPEYDVIETMALRALAFADRVIINAPYTGEMDRELNGVSDARLRNLRRQLNERGCKLLIIYMNLTREIAKQRWQKRFGTDPDAAKRTPLALENLDAFLDQQHLELPADTTVADCDYFFLFDTRDPDKSFRDLKAFMGVSSAEPYDCDITKKPAFAAVKF